MIPSVAEKMIHHVLTKKMSIKPFEQWLYTDDLLESDSPDLYLELISFDYSSEDNFKDFYSSFAKYVHFYKFEADRIKEHLQSIINKNEKSADSILMTYNLYCSGYRFLQKLGILYGLCVVDSSYPVILTNDSTNIIDKFYPNIIEDARNVIEWLEEGKIILKDVPNDYGAFEYDDFRSEAEVLQGKA